MFLRYFDSIYLCLIGTIMLININLIFFSSLFWYCFMYVYLCRHRNVLGFVSICSFLFILFSFHSRGVNIHTLARVGEWSRHRWILGWRTHIWEGEFFTKFKKNMNVVCVYLEEAQTRMNIKMLALEHGVTNVYISGDASMKRYTETYYNWNIYVVSGHDRVIVKYIHMNIAIKLHEYGRGGKCKYMFRYLYSWIREMKMQMEEKDVHMGNSMCTSIGTVT